MAAKWKVGKAKVGLAHARKILDEQGADEQSKGKACKKLGLDAIKRGERAKGIDLLVQATELGISDGVVWRTLGEQSLAHYVDTGNRDFLDHSYSAYEQASHHWDAVTSPAVQLGLGNVYKEYGSYEGALQVYATIITDFPRWHGIAEVTFQSACVLKHMGEFAQAITYLEYILDSPPRCASGLTLLFMLARLYELSERTKEANDAFSAVFKSFKKANEHDGVPSWRRWHASAGAWRRMARKFSVEHNYVMAADTASQALQLEETHEWDHEMWSLLAKSYVRINETENATAAAEAALALDPYNMQTRSLILELNPDTWKPYLDEQNNAAVILQRNFRGKCGRRKAWARRKYVAMLHNKAVDIERAFRGHVGRSIGYQMRFRWNRATDIQRVFRGFLGRLSADMWKYKVMCVIRCQAGFRGYATRKFVQGIPGRAATAVQRIARGFLARRALQRLRVEDEAVRTLQKIARGHHGRLQAKHKRACLALAIRIQAVYRGWCARKEARARRRFVKSVTRLQAKKRGFDGRALVAQMKFRYAQIVQAAFRGSHDRRVIAIWRAARLGSRISTTIHAMMTKSALRPGCSFLSTADEDFEVTREYFGGKLQSDDLIIDEGLADGKTLHVLSSLLHSNETLQTLLIGKGRMGDRGLASLCSALRTNRALRKLGIGGNRITSKGAIALSEFLRKNNFNLTSLYIEDNEVGDDGARHLAESIGDFFFGRYGRMVSFSLIRAGFGDFAGTCFGNALAINRRLVSLDLGGNFIGNAGAIALALALKRNPVLKALDLRDNEVGDEGASALATVLRRENKSLTSLALDDNFVKDRSARLFCIALNENLSLRRLGLAGNPVSPAVLAQVEQARGETAPTAAQKESGGQGRSSERIELRGRTGTHVNLVGSNPVDCVGASAIDDGHQSPQHFGDPAVHVAHALAEHQSRAQTKAQVKARAKARTLRKLNALEAELYERARSLSGHLSELGNTLQGRAKEAAAIIGERATTRKRYLGQPFGPKEVVLGHGRVVKRAPIARATIVQANTWDQRQTSMALELSKQQVLKPLPYVKRHARAPGPQKRLPSLALKSYMPSFGR